MRYLFIPENNSLSHIAKCLSIQKCLMARGHEVHLAVSRQRSVFLRKQGIAHHLLPDVQETDNSGFPTFKWFNSPNNTITCIKAETALINEIKPDRVVGVFRFTLKASSILTGVPYDSLICGCMLPQSPDVLGFSPEDDAIKFQEKLLNTFFQYAGEKASIAFDRVGVDKIPDIRMAFEGDRTFLWDFPEFMPIPAHPAHVHVGPINLRHWPSDRVDMESLTKGTSPLAVVSFGTCITQTDIAKRMVRILVDMGYMVAIAAGGQKEMMNIMPGHPRVHAFYFAPLDRIFPHASLLVTHGGQMTVFEALRQKIPVLVLPFQPEQAHNGICLERIGCGSRLIPPQIFMGDPGVYLKAMKQVTDDDIALKIKHLVTDPKIRINLDEMQYRMQQYQGENSLAEFFQEGHLA